MGGSGNASPIKKMVSKDGALDLSKTYKIENRKNSYGWTKKILEADTDGNGNISFSYPTGSNYNKTSKTSKTLYADFEIKSGAIDGEFVGINWDKVNSVSGQTFDIKGSIKEKGFKWDGANKRWVRK